MTSIRFIFIISIGLLLAASSLRAETLVVVGVMIDAKGDRVAGAPVRLCATETKIGAPLAEDRTSSRGVFTLYRNNIGGDLGELYVVYAGDDGKAEPVKVTLSPVMDGRREARTSDLVVLTVPVATAVAKPDALAYLAASTNTETVLVKAGIKTQAAADALIKQQTETVLARASLTGTEATAAAEDELGKRLIDGTLTGAIMSANPRAAAVNVR
jgi:hypothetical protein